MPEDRGTDDTPKQIPDEERVSPKDSARAEIFDDVSESRLDELREDGFEIEAEIAAADDGPIDDDDPGFDDERSDDVAAAAEADVSPPPEDDAAAPGMREVVVNGQKHLVSDEEMVRSFQIESAARQRLEEANNQLTRAQTILANAEANDVRAMEAPVEDAEPPEDPLEKIDWNGVVSELQDGNPEDAARSFKKLVSDLRNIPGPASADPGTSDVELASRAASQVRQELEWDESIARFGADYVDIMGDQVLASLTGQYARRLVDHELQRSAQTGSPRRPFYDIFAHAGEQVRQWRGKVQDSGQAEPNPNPPSASLSEDRAAKKHNSGSPPRSRPVARRSASEPDRAPSPDEIRQEGIAELTASRKRGAQAA